MKKTLFLITLISIAFTSFSQDVFDIGIRKVEIFFSEPNWDDTLDYYYANDLGRLLADSVVIDGQMDDSVGVKYKGNSSYSVNNGKNPLNIRLDWVKAGQSIDNYNVLKFSNGFRDPSFVREVLAYEIAREYMPASKATYANVFINGNWNGLYTCVQSVDDDFTNEHFYERKGPFFKGEITNLSIAGCPAGPLGIWKYYSDTNCLQKAYEIQSTADWTQLGNFLDTVNNYFTDVEKVLDIDRTLWMMAFSNLTITLDGPINNIPHNFYMFKDNNGRFSPIIWDLNGSFGTFKNGLTQPVTTQDLQELDVFHGYNNNQNKMTSKIFSSAQYKRMYVAHMRTILNEQFANGNYNTRALQLQAIIDSSVNTEPNGFYSHTEFLSNINSSVGSPNSIVGISQLMGARTTFIQSLPEFTAIPPTISNITSSPISPTPHSTVTISAEITNATEAYLGYRFKFHDAFKKITMLNNGSGTFSATISVDARDVQYYIYADNNDAGIFSPEKAEKEFHQLAVVSDLVINDIMASNISSVTDQSGEYDDWVELYNGGATAVNLSGFFLSDDENTLNKWTFPNTTIQPNGYLIIWCDTAGTSQTGLHTTYRLSSDQEEVYLTDPSGTVIDAVHFVNMPNDVAYARVPNGMGTFIHQSETYNANNQITSFIIDAENNIERLRVYPNPSNNRIYILGAKGNLIIHNSMGQEVFNKEANSTISVDISSWNAGVYFVKSNQKVIKVIKQ
ncbi:MAG: CotH kinase family protein [Flavobacteriales bacterium]|nr:CotH kinase family protein [Flavobacteriales bacterium]